MAERTTPGLRRRLVLLALLGFSLPAPATADRPKVAPAILLPADAQALEASALGPGLAAAAALPAHGIEGIHLPGLAGTRVRAQGSASLSGRVAVQREPETFVREFLDGAGAALGVRGAQVARRDRRQAGRLTHEFYEQLHDGLPIIGSRLAFTFGSDGTLLQLRTRLAGDLAALPERPALSLAEAQTRARDGLAGPGAIEWHGGELAVLPALVSGLAEDRLVWRLHATTPREHLGWRILVDAQRGELLERRPLVRAAVDPGSGSPGPAGRVEALVRTPTPWDEEVRLAVRDARLTLPAESPAAEEQYTDASGAFAFAYDPGPADHLRAHLEGRYAQVHVEAWGGPVPYRDVAPPLPGDLTIVWDSLAASPGAIAAYVHVQTAHAWLARIDPGFVQLDLPLPVVVDDPISHCNAMAYDDPLNPWLRFLEGSEGCANAARVADVVYHEYGHLITMYAYDPEYAPDVLHEAFSDYFAATLADTSAIGVGFFGPDAEPLRNLDNDLTWPVRPDCAYSAHCVGQLLGGALWDMRAGLIAELGDKARGVALADSLFHTMRAGKPHDFAECLEQLLLQDDDDQDLSNGTPHLEVIAAAFERHNIGDFAVYALHTVPPDTEDTTATTPIDVAVRSVYPPAPGGVEIHYTLRGEERAATMVAVPGEDRLYRWELPPQPPETTVRYFITAQDTRGRSTTIPPGSRRYELVIGPDRVAPAIAHEQPSPPAAGQAGLWLAAQAQDNTGRIASVTAVGAVSTPAGSRPVTATLLRRAPGDSLFAGFLATGELAAGDTLRYHIEAVDQARTPNTARYPTQSQIVLHALAGRAWDLESEPLEFSLSGDWAWGQPSVGPAAATSGSRLLATNPAGLYRADTRSYATLPDLDLSSWSHGLLEFASWYRIEEGWDGGWIEASTDGGQRWRQLAPADGYAGSIPYDRDGDGVDESTIAAFTGTADAWRRVLVPLDALVGSTVRIRLAFDSDLLVNDVGWFVDDLKVIATQALVPPIKLSASAGDDRSVALHWSAPQGIDESAQSFLGYNVYRGTSPADYAPTPLNPTPRHQRWWYDSQVENGVRYYYGVTTVFDIGESPPSAEALGYPYRAGLGGDALGGGIAVRLEGTPSGGDTLWIENTGSGELRLEFFPADAGQTWDDVRPQFTVSPSSAFAEVARDPAGDAEGPDLRRLACRATGDHLQMRIGFEGPLPDPRTEFTLAVFLDTDLSRATGIPGPNTGAEYILVLGEEVYRRYSQLGVVTNATGEVVGPPSHIILQAGLDSIEAAVPLDLIGSPSKVGLGIALGREGLLPDPTWLRSTHPIRCGTTNARPDSLPGTWDSGWLSVDSTTAVVLPERPWGLPLAFHLEGRLEDEYRAQLWIASNDPSLPRRAVPIAVELGDLPVAGLTTWSAASAPEGLRLAWSPDEPAAFAGFLLTRWEGALEDEEQAVPVGGGLIIAPDGTNYAHLDRSVAGGKRYFYRLSGVRFTGDTLSFSPPAHPRYDPPPAEALVLESARPNPFAGNTLLRVRAPEAGGWELAVLDVGGRLVRRLVARGQLGPGTHLVAWDGRTQVGAPAGAGLYLAVARAGGQSAARKLMLLR